MITTPLCTLLGIERPILNASMAGTATGELAAAVSEAGGFGMIGGTNPDEPVHGAQRHGRPQAGHDVGRPAAGARQDARGGLGYPVERVLGPGAVLVDAVGAAQGRVPGSAASQKRPFLKLHVRGVGEALVSRRVVRILAVSRGSYPTK